MKFKLPNFKDLPTQIMALPLVRDFIKWTQEHSLPGFSKVPLYDVAVFIYNELRRFDLTTRANAIAFSFFLSLFPSIMALFTLFPYIQIYFIPYLPEGESFNAVLRTQILELMPGNAGERLTEFIIDIVDNPRMGLTSIGFFLATFFASNGMIMMMRSFQKSYKSTFKKRNPIMRRLVAIQMVIVIGIMVVSSVLLVILGKYLIAYLLVHIHADRFTAAFIYAIRWIIIIGLYYFGIALLYRKGASTIRQFSWFTPGATIATILSLASSIGFSFFVDNFGAYNKLYGSIGTIIVVMLWIQINSFLILVGYELNASIAVNRDLKKQIPEKS